MGATDHLATWTKPTTPDRPVEVDAAPRLSFRAEVTAVDAFEPRLVKRETGATSEANASTEVHTPKSVTCSATDTQAWRTIWAPGSTLPRNRAVIRTIHYSFSVANSQGRLECSPVQIRWKLPLGRRLAGAASLPLSLTTKLSALTHQWYLTAPAGGGWWLTNRYANFTGKLND